MAIAFKPPEIQSIGQYHHYQSQAQSAVATPPASPVSGAGQVSSPSDASITVTDSVPRSVVVQHLPQPILVPQSVVFHPIPPIFLLPQTPANSAIASPPPSPVIRVVGPRQSCPPAERCRMCMDIQRVSLLVSLVVLSLVC